MQSSYQSAKFKGGSPDIWFAIPKLPIIARGVVDQAPNDGWQVNVCSRMTAENGNS
jgi:hypothetical protein